MQAIKIQKSQKKISEYSKQTSDEETRNLLFEVDIQFFPDIQSNIDIEWCLTTGQLISSQLDFLLYRSENC